MAIQKNFNVVGNPTITEEGIASNFSTTNYLTLSGIETSISDTSWTLQIGLTTPISETSHSQFFLGNRNSYNGVVFQLYQNKLTAYLGTGSSWDITSGTIESTENLSLGTFYYISLSYTGTSYSLKYSTNKSDWIEVFNIETNSKVTLKDLLVGACWDLIDGQVFKGSVDLKELKITSNGEEVWNAWKDVGIIPGTITVDKGYYNADGTNIIKFTSPVTKTLTESAYRAEWKNYVFLTLDQQDQSSFVVHNDWSPFQGDYKASKKLETTSIYLDPSLNYILGTEPTGIEYTVTPQTPGGTYELKYLTLNGSVSYDETTGKLSGFSTSNYATSSSGITFGSSFDLIFNVTVANASTQQTLFYGQNDSGLLFTSGKIAAWFGDNILGKTSVVNGNTYWIRLVWSGTSYTCYSLLDDGTYTLATLPELSSWTQEFTYSSSSNIFAPGYWVGYHSQATSQYARSTFNMGKAQITTNGVTYRYANGDSEAGSVSFTQGWLYNQMQNRTYQNKDTAPVSVEQLKENNAEGATIGYKNSLGLKFDQTSDVSLPIIASTFGGVYNYNFNQDIYLDNTKTKILGTTTASESWAEGTTPYVITPGTSASDVGSITYKAGYKYIDETYGSLFIPENTTKTLDELVDPSSRTEHMKLVLGLKQDGTTDFFLSGGGLLPPGYTYTEDIVDVYLDRTLSYIYGTTADPRVKFTVNATPNTATINMVDSDGEAEVTGTGTASILVPAGHQVTWDVSLTGYTSQSGEETVAEDTTKNITLVEDSVTFTITPTPSDATVKINDIVQNSVEVEKGSTVTWSVEKTGYVTQSGEEVVNEDTTKEVTLQEEAPRYSFTMSATPNTATITLADGSNTITGTGTATLSNIPEGNEVSYNVSASGYITQSGTEVITSDISKSIELEVETFTLTINPTPADATITLTAEGYTQSGNSITVPSGTSIQWSVTADGYTAQSGTQIVSSDLTLPITLESSTVETYTLSVSTDPADANIEISGDYEEIPAERTEPTLPTQTFWRWYNAESPSSNAMMTVVENPTEADYIYVSDAVTTNTDPFACNDTDGTSDETISSTESTVEGNIITRGGVQFIRDSSAEYTKCSMHMNESNMKAYISTDSSETLYEYDTVTGELTNTNINKGTSGYTLMTGYWMQTSIIENASPAINVVEPNFNNQNLYFWGNSSATSISAYTFTETPTNQDYVVIDSSSTLPTDPLYTNPGGSMGTIEENMLNASSTSIDVPQIQASLTRDSSRDRLNNRYDTELTAWVVNN